MKAIASSRRPGAIIPGLMLLASCAAPQTTPVLIQPPQPAPAPAPAPPPSLPNPPADWRDAAQTAGSWRWGVAEGRSTASFVAPDSSILARLACDRPGARVLLARRGDAEGAVPMALTSTFGTRPLFSNPERSSSGWVQAELHTNDPILDSIAFSRGRFVLEVAGLDTLYLPSWPEISRVIEDCR